VTPRKREHGFRKDRRHRHHHWVVTLFYSDGGTFERVYIDREKARRFAKRQKKSPVVVRTRVKELV